MEGRRFVIRNSAIRVRPIISGPRSAMTSTAPGRSLRTAFEVSDRGRLHRIKAEAQSYRARSRAVEGDRGEAVRRIYQDGYARQGRKQLLEQLQSFPFRVGGLPGEPGDVASWMSQIADETGGDRVARFAPRSEWPRLLVWRRQTRVFRGRRST